LVSVRRAPAAEAVRLRAAAGCGRIYRKNRCSAAELRWRRRRRWDGRSPFDALPQPILERLEGSIGALVRRLEWPRGPRGGRGGNDRSIFTPVLVGVARVPNARSPAPWRTAGRRLPSAKSCASETAVITDQPVADPGVVYPPEGIG
jgi:hypothetical protein